MEKLWNFGGFWGISFDGTSGFACIMEFANKMGYLRRKIYFYITALFGDVNIWISVSRLFLWKILKFFDYHGYKYKRCTIQIVKINYWKESFEKKDWKQNLKKNKMADNFLLMHFFEFLGKNHIIRQKYMKFYKIFFYFVKKIWDIDGFL